MPGRVNSLYLRGWTRESARDRPSQDRHSKRAGSGRARVCGATAGGGSGSRFPTASWRRSRAPRLHRDRSCQWQTGRRQDQPTGLEGASRSPPRLPHGIDHRGGASAIVLFGTMDSSPQATARRPPGCLPTGRPRPARLSRCLSVPRTAASHFVRHGWRRC